MNYAQLTAAVSSTVENTFSADDMARFTRLTEQKIYEFVRLPVQVETFTGNLTAGNRFVAVPSGYRSTLSLMVLNGQDAEFLLQKDVSYIRSAYPGSNVTGLPKVYAQQDETQIVVGPTPNLAYPVEWQYEAFPESIVTAGTSWLGDNFDSVLFNGILVETARFMKEEQDIITQYEKMFGESMIQLQKIGVAKLRQDIYKPGQARTNRE